MKVKEIELTANIAWSPAGQHPIYLAAGTAAQQLDATFSTSASLDLYQLNLGDPSLDMKLVGSIPSDHRFNKLVWGGHGLHGSETPSGVLIGGADKGKVFVWNPDAVLRGTDPLIQQLNKHTGSVAALDINNFQTNLLATGANDSEIFIWDLNNTSNPMTPGAKSQPPDDVTCIAWNHQVQHILASTYAGRCVVWDLRKNEPIIKVSDSMSRIKCKLVAWHPEVATQMCLASEDDHSPVIQLWDLRFATSPLKSLESHTRGILSMAWCPQDPDLLLSCGKDNRILCWNPNTTAQTGEVVYELPTSNQWSFDVQWCPRNPAIISSCSFDGHVSVYSLMGGGKAPQPSDKIADSFPADPFSQVQTSNQTQQQQPTVPLKKPPKWLRRPVGASFAFGGKLVTFEHSKPTHPQQPTQKLVHISQVVTETDLISRSNQLEHAISNNQFAEFCSMKVANSRNETEENTWNFLRVPFENDPRTRYLQLLGYDQTELAKKVSELTGSDFGGPQEKTGVNADELAQKMAVLNAGSEVEPKSESSCQGSPRINTSETTGMESFGQENATSAFDNIGIQDDEMPPDSPLPIATTDDLDGLVTQALLMADFEAAVEVCLHNDRLAEAIVLAIAGGPELLARTQKKVFQASKTSLNRLISSVVTKDFEHVICTCELDSWKEALALALTYCRGEQFASLCEILGRRLETERNGELAVNACLCYICAGNVERLVACWSRISPQSHSPSRLQDLIEKVVVLRRAVDTAAGQASATTGTLLAEKLSRYAELLAAQGSLTTALNYLGNSNQMPLAILRDRLSTSLGIPSSGRPFNVVSVRSKPAPQAAVVQPQVPVAAPATRQRTPSGHYQAQAAGTFQTTTTQSTMYSTSQHQYAQPQVPSQQPMYSQAPVNAPAKGALAQRYGGYPDVSQVSQVQPMSQPYNPYQTPTQPHSSAGYPTPYDPSAYTQAAVTSQPNVYNPGQQIPGFVRSMTPPLSGSRRSSKYSDTEALAGVVENVTPPSSSRRESVFSLESDSCGFYISGAPYMPPAGPQTPSFQEVRPTTPWNDPPILKEKKEMKRYEAPAPITQPIFGAPQPEQAPPGAPNYGGTQIYNPTDYSNQPEQVPVQHPTQMNAHNVPPHTQQMAPPEPPKPVPKGPIPAEHQILHDIFENLATVCLNSTNHPQTKRKLEDVLRKLETLYDKLRENMLSQRVTMGLHQIAAAIQAYDYATGMGYHTMMISQGNFSEISSFMPSIKTLVQTAMHLQVYVQ